MIYELRTYTLKNGTAPAAAQTAGTLGRDIRGDNYGKLEGYWITEIGPLNQVMHLWSYPDLNERAKVRAALSQNKRWTSEYVPEIREKLVRQEVRLMHGIIAPTKPATDGNIYEFRNYRIKPTMIGQWIGHFREALPVREKYSKIAGLFQTESGQPNEVCHFWPYPDLIARGKVRAAATADKDWQAFVAKISPLLEEMHSTILLPAAHSPLK